MARAKVPDSILSKFKEASGSSSVEGWVDTIDATKAEQFRATVRLYMERKAAGKLRMSYLSLASELKRVFGFPFGWGALRLYMRRLDQALFERQQIRR